MITIEGIRAEDAPEMWPHVSEWCEAALRRGGGLLTLDDLKQGVSDHLMQMWVAREDGRLLAVVVSELVKWPRGKVLSAFIVAGEEMHKWLPQFDDVMTRYARAMGCSFLAGESRKGWERVLKPLGWEAPSVTYLKRL